MDSNVINEIIFKLMNPGAHWHAPVAFGNSKVPYIFRCICNMYSDMPKPVTEYNPNFYDTIYERVLLNWLKDEAQKLLWIKFWHYYFTQDDEIPQLFDYEFFFYIQENIQEKLVKFLALAKNRERFGYEQCPKCKGKGTFDHEALGSIVQVECSCDKKYIGVVKKSWLVALEDWELVHDLDIKMYGGS